jgi:hypothetical protein
MSAVYGFQDGTQLVVSTQYFAERQFVCRLYLSKRGGQSPVPLDEPIVGDTCRDTQGRAYQRAQALYPAHARAITSPPYLVCCGPEGYAERTQPRWRRPATGGGRRKKEARS